MKYEPKLFIDISKSHVTATLQQNNQLKFIHFIPHNAYTSQGPNIENLQKVITFILEKIHIDGISKIQTFVSLFQNKSIYQTIHFRLHGLPLTTRDMTFIFKHVQSHLPETLHTLHTIPIGFQLDDKPVKQPYGLPGENLKIFLHLITIEKQWVEGIRILFQERTIPVHFVSRLYHTFQVFLPDSVKKYNAIGLLFDYRTTDVILYKNNIPVYIDSIPLGDAHITMDLAKVLKRSPKDVVKIKSTEGRVLTEKIGNLIEASFDNYVGAIITARIEEILGMVTDSLEQFSDLIVPFCALTGFGSLLTGLDIYTEQYLDKETFPLQLPFIPNMPFPMQNISPLLAMYYKKPQLEKEIFQKNTASNTQNIIEWILYNF